MVANHSTENEVIDEKLPWWKSEQLRLLQPNLREIDADLNVDTMFEYINQFNANALLLNTGGVCAFYPTDLNHHPRADPLEDRSDGDLIGTVLERCRKEEIRFIARFDFSKFHESVFEARPEWAYRDPNGNHVNYHGVVHACINGGYQREYAFHILEEALSQYPVDGVFFNMFGYNEHDYSGNYYGPCHCENCRHRFMEFTNSEATLPPKDYDNIDYPEYQRFKRKTATELVDRVRDIVNRFERDIAVATYSQRGTDAVTDESNTGIDRSLPRWQYSAVDNIATVEDSWDKPAWNISINAVDIPYRFQGVSEPEIRTRLYGALLRGSELAFCVNGSFADYPDTSNFESVEEVYGIASDYTEIFKSLSPIADIALVKPTNKESQPEYRGWFRLLTESHIPFHVRSEESIGHDDARPINGAYDVIVIPNAHLQDEAAQETLMETHNNGTALLATGARVAINAPDILSTIFGTTRESIYEDDEVRGGYVDTTTFDALSETEWVIVDDAFAAVTTENVETDLPFVTPGTFGPPERVGREGFEYTDNPGLILQKENNENHSIYLPWGPGQMYYHHGFDAHAGVLSKVLEVVRTTSSLFETDAPPTIEITLSDFPQGYLLQMLNRSGFAGISYHDPPVIEDISVEINNKFNSSELLIGDGDVMAETIDNKTRLSLEDLNDYAAILLEQNTN